MAITSYFKLKTAIQEWLHRSDVQTLSVDLIDLAEQRMNGDISSRQMETTATLVCVPGPTTAARYVTLPTDMLEMRRLMNVTADPSTVLEYKSPDQLVADNLNLFDTGKPTAFTVIGGRIELSPTPDAAYSLELVYKQAIPPLSDTNLTNWVLDSYPGAYLFGSLVASVPYTQDEAKLPLWESRYQEIIRSINAIDWYSGSTLRVRAR